MTAGTCVIMKQNENTDLGSFEKEWNAAEKVLVRGKITKEASDFLEERAFHDFGMMKKGAIGMELTKLLLVARDCIESKKEE
jgi:hypothetical protein